MKAGNSDIEYPTDSELNRLSENYGNRFAVQDSEKNISKKEEDDSADDHQHEDPQKEYSKNKYLNQRSYQ